MAKQGQDVKKTIHTTRQCKKQICEDNKEFNDALMEQNINAVLYMQTANSPNVNLLDLGFLEPCRVSTICAKKQRGIDTSG